MTEIYQMSEQISISSRNLEVGLRNFESIVVKIDDKKTYQKALRQANKKYDIKNFKVLNMTPVKARKYYPQIVEKYRQNLALKQSWLENQRRLFIWIVLCYSFIAKKSIIDLTFDEFSIFSSIFNLKNENFLKFQIFAILKRPKKRSKWAIQEDDALLKVLSLEKFDSEELEWNQISKQFFYLTENQFYRSSKQCRQRWMNHLDPNKIKGSWAIEHDYLLLKFVKQKGKKWSQIVKQLDGCKTQHMVKNRFNSLVNKKAKQMKSKNQTKIINSLLGQIEIQEIKIVEDQFITSSKQANSIKSSKSDRVKSQKNDEILNIFENESNSGNQKFYKFVVRKAGSLSISEKDGILPQLANPILQEMDSQQQRIKQNFFIKTPLSERGGQIKSPSSYLMASPLMIGNGGNLTPSMFFLQQNIKVGTNNYASDFSMSFSSNFDKFVPQQS